MAPRLELHAILKTFVDNVYFQPKHNIELTYPCIIYKRDDEDTEFADNRPYARKTKYMVTVVDRDPDSSIPNLVASLPMSLFNRFYTADDLNHDVYNVYF